MGNWHLSITGIGCHHNDDEKIDVDLAAKKFVALLEDMGQTIEHATLTAGSRVDLMPAPLPPVPDEVK